MTSRAPWLGHYDPGVPASLAPYPSRILLDYVADAVEEARRTLERETVSNLRKTQWETARASSPQTGRNGKGSRT